MRPRLLIACLLGLLAGCGVGAETAAPECADVERTALVAQSVPQAAYVPCLRDVPVGWRPTAFQAQDGSAAFTLLSDRADGRPVRVVLEPSCDISGASPGPPRAEGVRSHLRLDEISPRFSGTTYDVFPGGCVLSTFSFPRGLHIPLMEELREAVDLVPRRELRVQVRRELGVELDP